ncbi:MAG: CBS domain-containing protein [Planctomycetota bacterium]
MRTAEKILREKESGREIVSVPAEATIREALEVMLAHRIGAIAVKEGGKIAGIWTERDLLRNTASEGFDPKTTRVRDVMVRSLLSAPHTATVFQLLDMFLGRRLRHLFIEKDGEYIGLLSTGDVVRAALLDKTEEARELSSLLNWEYYENWYPKKKS